MALGCWGYKTGRECFKLKKNGEMNEYKRVKWDYSHLPIYLVKR